MMYQATLKSHHLRPWQAEKPKAWWLLCHSPKETTATHQVAGEVSGFVRLGAPHVRRAVDKEGAVPYAHTAQRATPYEGRPTAHYEQQLEGAPHVHPIPLVHVSVEGLRAHIVHVALHLATRTVVLAQFVHDPAHVRPPEALCGRVGVERRVCLKVVEPMARHPLGRLALHPSRHQC